MESVAIAAALVVAYGVVSRRLESTLVTGPMAFVAAGLRLWEAALLAAVLAPTDAALGRAVVTNRDVPVRIRETLSVESGLNDGIALPLVTCSSAWPPGRRLHCRAAASCRSSACSSASACWPVRSSGSSARS